MMFDLKCNSFYKKGDRRVTRSMGKYIFETDIVRSGVYARSPYYKGSSLWNTLPTNLQSLPNKGTFKRSIKKHLNAY